MRAPLRLSLVILGLAAALYGTASLTGGWLGRPPWWECTSTVWEVAPPKFLGPVVIEVEESEPRPGREWISGGVVAVGLALSAFGAWRRMSGVEVTPAVAPSSASHRPTPAEAAGMSRTAQIRWGIRETLTLLADTEQQRAYERDVPIADVPSELFCMWFDDQYLADDATFQASFSIAERRALAEFNALYTVVGDELKSLGIGASVVWLHAQPAWARVVDGAKTALLSLEAERSV